MKQSYVYMLSQKSTGIPIQEVFMSRQEGRNAKKSLEARDGTRYNVVRFKLDKTIR